MYILSNGVYFWAGCRLCQLSNNSFMILALLGNHEYDDKGDVEERKQRRGKIYLFLIYIVHDRIVSALTAV